MHVEGIEGSKHCGTLSACVRESIWKMFALNVVAHIAHRVVGELFTDGARRFPSCSVSCHINIEVLRLCKFTLNKKPGINSCHIFSCGKFLWFCKMYFDLWLKIWQMEQVKASTPYSMYLFKSAQYFNSFKRKNFFFLLKKLNIASGTMIPGIWGLYLNYFRSLKGLN